MPKPKSSNPRRATPLDNRIDLPFDAVVEKLLATKPAKSAPKKNPAKKKRGKK